MVLESQALAWSDDIILSSRSPLYLSSVSSDQGVEKSETRAGIVCPMFCESMTEYDHIPRQTEERAVSEV